MSLETFQEREIESLKKVIAEQQELIEQLKEELAENRRIEKELQTFMDKLRQE